MLPLADDHLSLFTRTNLRGKRHFFGIKRADRRSWPRPIRSRTAELLDDVPADVIVTIAPRVPIDDPTLGIALGSAPPAGHEAADPCRALPGGAPARTPRGRGA